MVKRSQTPNGSGCRQGVVLDVSRRFVTIVLDDNTTVSGTVSSKTLEVVPGDVVSFDTRAGKVFVTSVAPSRRNLYRSSRSGVKRMGAHIDALLIISAPGATFNPIIIDRMLVAAQVQDIPVFLVINKVDLGTAEVERFLSVYRRIGVEVLLTSAKRGDGMSAVEAIVNRPEVGVVALCGVSGVGKSTILNALVPGARARIGAVSERTGQGKQTTSQPHGFLYAAKDGGRRIVIDLPGVQFFGLSHISARQVSGAFPEILEAARGCQFGDCKHIKESVCGVQDALARGDIAPWRFDSYMRILNEVIAAEEF